MEKELLWDLIFEAKKEAFKKGHPLRMPILGWSMFPALTNSDSVIIVSGENKKFRPGDILVSQTGSFVAHRLIRIRHKGNQRVFITKGDTQLHCDSPVSKEAIVGRIELVIKPWFSLSLNSTAGRALNIICLVLSVVRFWTPGLIFFGKMVRLLRRIR